MFVIIWIRIGDHLFLRNSWENLYKIYTSVPFWPVMIPVNFGDVDPDSESLRVRSLLSFQVVANHEDFSVFRVCGSGGGVMSSQRV